MSFQRTYLGHGIGLRSKHYGRMLEEKPPVGWFEVISENFMARGGRPTAVLEKVRRDLPVVMASGHLSDESREQARRVGLRAVLQKENTAEQLGPLIQRVLIAAKEPDPRRRPRMIEV